jgi:hypothetical protein
MEPYIIHSAILAPVDAELILEVCSGNFDVSFILETVSHEIVGLHLLVVLVVRSDHIHLLAQTSQLFR